jgi:hypothetical protein
MGSCGIERLPTLTYQSVAAVQRAAARGQCTWDWSMRSSSSSSSSNNMSTLMQVCRCKLTKPRQAQACHGMCMKIRSRMHRQQMVTNIWLAGACCSRASCSCTSSFNGSSKNSSSSKSHGSCKNNSSNKSSSKSSSRQWLWTASRGLTVNSSSSSSSRWSQGCYSSIAPAAGSLSCCALQSTSLLQQTAAWQVTSAVVPMTMMDQMMDATLGLHMRMLMWRLLTWGMLMWRLLTWRMLTWLCWTALLQTHRHVKHDSQDSQSWLMQCPLRAPFQALAVHHQRR